jgi:spore germination cell wall hydrolase CwlJ-like protein
MDGRTLASLAALAVAALVAAPKLAWAPQPVAGSSPPLLPVAAAPAPPPERQLSRAELRCLALNVYWESRGQPLTGQSAVAHVTLNRAADPRFPHTICGVVYQGCQFGWTCDRRANSPTDDGAWTEAVEIARRAAAGERDPTGGALYFHHVQERPQWARGRYGHRVVIGQHVFFNTEEDQQVAEVR